MLMASNERAFLRGIYREKRENEMVLMQTRLSHIMSKNSLEEKRV